MSSRAYKTQSEPPRIKKLALFILEGCIGPIGPASMKEREENKVQFSQSY